MTTLNDLKQTVKSPYTRPDIRRLAVLRGHFIDGVPNKKQQSQHVKDDKPNDNWSTDALLAWADKVLNREKPRSELSQNTQFRTIQGARQGIAQGDKVHKSRF